MGAAVRPVRRARRPVAPSGVVRMSDDECWSYLKHEKLGRVTIVVNGFPNVFPVNYAMGDDLLVFRTSAGTRLVDGRGWTSCFEIDGYDPDSLKGWSVMAFGRLREISGGTETTARNHWIAMKIDSVSGCRFIGTWVVPEAFRR